MIAEKNTAVIEAAKTFLQMFVAQCSQCANRAGSFNPGGGGYSLIWAIRGHAAGQGMVFWPRCPKQGVQFDLPLS